MDTRCQPGDYSTTGKRTTRGTPGRGAAGAGSTSPDRKPNGTEGGSGRTGATQPENQYHCPYRASDSWHSSATNQPPLSLVTAGAAPSRFLPWAAAVRRSRD